MYNSLCIKIVVYKSLTYVVYKTLDIKDIQKASI